ncbi:MAG: PAS domain-containing protein, partial [Chitinophagaceae bacterium]
RKTIFSDNVLRVLGWKQAVSLTSFDKILDHVHPDDRSFVKAASWTIYEEQVPPNIEFRIQQSDGKSRYIKLRSWAFTNAEGDPVIFGIFHDFTKTKRFEAELLQLKNNYKLQRLAYKQVEEVTNIGNWLWNLNTGKIIWSENIYRLTGLKPFAPELTKEHLLSVIHPDDIALFQASMNKILSGEQYAECKVCIITKGETIHVKAFFRLLQQDGETYFAGTLQNITEEELNRQQLVGLVQLADLIGDSLQDKVIGTDSNHNITIWNTRSEEVHGIKKADAIGKNFFDLVPQLKLPLIIENLKKVLNGETIHIPRVKLLSHSYYMMTMVPVKKGNQVIGALHILRDITQEYQLQEQLTLKLNFIEGLLEASVDRIIVLDKNMNYLYWNKKSEDYYGFKKEEVIGRNILEIFPGFISDPSYTEFKKALKGQTVHIAGNQDPLLQNGYFETYLIPLKDEKQDVSGVLWMVHDLTKEFKLLYKLRGQNRQRALNEMHINAAQEITSIGSFEYDVSQKLTTWSDEMYKIYSNISPEEELTVEKINDSAHPEDQPALKKLFQELVEGITNSFDITYRLLFKDGSVKNIYTRARIAKFSEDGNVLKIIGAVQDITDQTNIAERLRDNQEFIQRIAKTNPRPIFIYNVVDGKYNYINDEGEKFLGYSSIDPNLMASELLGELVHPHELEKVLKHMKAMLEIKDDEVLSVEYRMQNANGEWQWFCTRSIVFSRNEDGSVKEILSNAQDIAKSKETEQELAVLKNTLKQAMM